MVTIHPGLVLGPSLTTASNSGCMTTMAISPTTRLPQVLRPCRWASSMCATSGEPTSRAGYLPEGHGCPITVAESISLLKISRILTDAFGRRASFLRRELPKVLIKLGAPFAGLTAKYVDRNVGWPLAFDNARTVHALDIDSRPAAESVVEHFQQMIDDGLVRASEPVRITRLLDRLRARRRGR